MTKSKKRYKAKCKRRYVDFYLNEEDLYEYSKTINFARKVKLMLIKEKHDCKTALERSVEL